MSIRVWWAIGFTGLLVTSAGPVSGGDADCSPSPWRSTPPLVIAHAGGEGLGPSNTIEAMERSIDAGADVLDADLRMTSDGVVVARHDRDVSSTTDGEGNVDDLTWAELERLDAATTWAGEGFDAPVRIPSLEQMLQRFPDTWLSLEIKQVEPSMAVALCDVLRRNHALDRVYLSANVDAAVYAAQAACGGEVLITTTYADLDRMRAADPGDAAWCAASPIGQPPYRAGLDRQQVDTSHRRGTALFVWTVDDPDVMLHLADIGVDGVYTRRPDIARRVFDEWS